MREIGRIVKIDELNGKIDKIKKIIDKIRERKSKLSYYYPGMPEKDIPKVIKKKKVSDGSAKEQVAFSEAIKELIVEGGMLKDLEEGLVDFRWMKGNKKAYLCWRYGEKEITHWHSLKGGCRSRRPI